MLGHADEVALLHPLRQAHYRHAVTELQEKREELLSKRRLRPGERKILKIKKNSRSVAFHMKQKETSKRTTCY